MKEELKNRFVPALPLMTQALFIKPQKKIIYLLREEK
jgi:hypothetical protein